MTGNYTLKYLSKIHLLLFLWHSHNNNQYSDFRSRPTNQPQKADFQGTQIHHHSTIYRQRKKEANKENTKREQPIQNQIRVRKYLTDRRGVVSCNSDSAFWSGKVTPSPRSLPRTFNMQFTSRWQKSYFTCTYNIPINHQLARHAKLSCEMEKK